MNRSTVTVLVVAVLAAAAIVAVAGTVDDLQTGGGGVPAGDTQPQPTTTETTTTSAPEGENDSRRDLPVGNQECISEAQHPLTILAILTSWAGIVGIVYKRRGQLEALSAFAIILVLLMVTYPVLAACGPQSDRSPDNQSAGTPDERNESELGEGGRGGSGDGDDGRSTPDFPIVVLAIVAVFAAAAVGGVLVTRDDEDTVDPFEAEEGEAETPPEGADVGEFAAAAGRAADRIEDAADVDNEIYRAWVEMTEHLDVEHPESSTPGEFARAAIDAGVDREDVRELTDLFERVRYGREEPTADREARALDALRRIDDQYGGEDS